MAALCTPEEIRDEVWAQLRAHLDDELDGVEVESWFLDEAIEFPNPSGATNAEPLLVNTKGSWADRPDASTAIPNLMLAADYVRTYTDLATMEGANEAARRAVNAILDATRSRAPRCELWPLREPPALRPARTLDKLLWRLHRPAPTPIRVSAAGGRDARRRPGSRRSRASRARGPGPPRRRRRAAARARTPRPGRARPRRRRAAARPRPGSPR